MKYLITGGAGFIGSHLAESLVARKEEVYILDNLSTGSLDNLKKIDKQIKFIPGNVLDFGLINDLVKECDIIVHLAASLGVLNIIKNPLASLSTNLQGTEIILQAAHLYEKQILIASTSEIYGKNEKIPLSEEDDRIIGHPLKARWSYSEAKAIDESLAYFYHVEKKLNSKIVRLFNTVGPRQIGDYGMVLPRFIKSALNNQTIYVYGTGDQIRCFCHVADVVRALLLVLDSEHAVGQVFNVGSNSQISIMDLAKKVIEFSGSKSKIQKLSYAEAYPTGFEDMQKRVPDISKINKYFQWTPEMNLEQIIKDIIAFNSD
jgi:UDP-glucose 4-epimerase